MKDCYHTLLIEVALDAGYALRLEQHASKGRITTRIVDPVVHRAPEGTTGGGTLVIRLADQSESPVDLDEVDRMSLATRHLPRDRAARGGWTVGDPIRHPRFGLGVVQSFVGGTDEARALVRFGGGEVRRLVLGSGGLERPGISHDGALRAEG
ncbi:MAG: hypothetical protein M3409_03935 [Gemmatimonadota bacterium]|nr:hypothetical protein [Gemmatimonadota bacterium]